MSPRAHFEHFSRDALRLMNFITLQLPSKYDVQIDRDKFLSSFSMTHGSERVCARKWPLGPQHSGVQTLPQEGEKFVFLMLFCD